MVPSEAMRRPSSNAMPNSKITRSALSTSNEPGQVASDLVSRWLKIDATISPIIGRDGVAALYHRSLQLTRLNNPWIARLRDGEDLKMDLTELERELEKQPADIAARAAAEFLATFRELLTGLIGQSLSERLLAFASAPPSTPKAEDLTR